MIKIIEKDNIIVISGHANYDEYGKDIVCASISSIVFSAISHWKNNQNFKITENSNEIILNLIDQNKTIDIIEFNFFKSIIKHIFISFPQNIKWVS